MLHQAYRYYRIYPGDRTFLKWLVSRHDFVFRLHVDPQLLPQQVFIIM